jgi:carbonic anhydrase
VALTDDLLEANRAFAQSFTQGGLRAEPSKHLAIVTCMDARIQLEQLLRLELGEAHIIRNAGGRVTDDVIRSLVLSSRLLGTREFLVIHHTECGLLRQTNEHIREYIRQGSSLDASAIDFLPFADLEESVREDVRRIKDTPLIYGYLNTRGFVYDVSSGRLSEVSVA